MPTHEIIVAESILILLTDDGQGKKLLLFILVAILSLSLQTGVEDDDDVFEESILLLYLYKFNTTPAAYHKRESFLPYLMVEVFGRSNPAQKMYSQYQIAISTYVVDRQDPSKN